MAMANYGVLDTWEFKPDARNEWRWKRIARNGNVVGASTEGYKNRLDCVANAKRHGFVESLEDIWRGIGLLPPQRERESPA